jgi:hypothetical protein
VLRFLFWQRPALAGQVMSGEASDLGKQIARHENDEQVARALDESLANIRTVPSSGRAATPVAGGPIAYKNIMKGLSDNPEQGWVLNEIMNKAVNAGFEMPGKAFWGVIANVEGLRYVEASKSSNGIGAYKCVLYMDGVCMPFRSGSG